MPIYEYQCTKCDHQLEALQKISEAQLVDCPACGKPSLSKLVSAASFRLKGGGWYETDFKTGKKKQLAESESTPASGAKSDTASASSDKKSSEGKKAAKPAVKNTDKASSKTASS